MLLPRELGDTEGFILLSLGSWEIQRDLFFSPFGEGRYRGI